MRAPPPCELPFARATRSALPSAAQVHSARSCSSAKAAIALFLLPPSAAESLSPQIPRFANSPPHPAPPRSRPRPPERSANSSPTCPSRLAATPPQILSPRAATPAFHFPSGAQVAAPLQSAPPCTAASP